MKERATATVDLARPGATGAPADAATAVPRRAVGTAEWAVLGILCERPAHGWAVARALDPSGELGAVWSVGRPLVYRSIDLLHDWKLIEPVGYEPGVRGPNRMVFRATVAGTDAVAQWLHEPVVHVRDIRSQLLLKLVLAERAGVDLSPMLVRQRREIVGILEALEAKIVDSRGGERILLRYRVETARGVLAFLDGLPSGAVPEQAAVGSA